MHTLLDIPDLPFSPVEVGRNGTGLGGLRVHVELKTGVDVVVARLGDRQPVPSVNHSP